MSSEKARLNPLARIVYGPYFGRCRWIHHPDSPGERDDLPQNPLRLCRAWIGLRWRWRWKPPTRTWPHALRVLRCLLTSEVLWRRVGLRGHRS